jgi:APA family basic amino acid/polyamine antiporter
MGLIMIGLALALFFAFLTQGGPADAGNLRAPAGPPGLAAFGLVVASVVFTYDGWYAASYFSEEVKSGGRGVAIGSLQAALIVFALYVLLNLAIVLSVPLAALVGHDLALAGALDLAYGAGAGRIVVFAAIFILLSHQNLQYMVASRVLYALSSDGLGMRKATSVNDKGTPAGAVVFTWAATSALIVAGQFEFLLNLVALLFMALYVGLVVGVFRLRTQEPGAQRPYRAWGFPATGIVCGIGWTAVAVFVAFTNPMSALSGVVLTLASVPAYLWLKRHRHLGEQAAA